MGSSQHASQQLRLENQIAQLDQQQTESKIEIVEMELLRTMRLEECEKECKELRNELTEQEIVMAKSQAIMAAQIEQLKTEIEAVIA